MIILCFRKNQKLSHVQTTCKSVHPCSAMIHRQSCRKDSIAHVLDVLTLFGTKKMECHSRGTIMNEVYFLLGIVQEIYTAEHRWREGGEGREHTLVHAKTGQEKDYCFPLTDDIRRSSSTKAFPSLLRVLKDQ